MTADEFAPNLDDGQPEYADSFHASLDAALAADRAAAQQVASVRRDEAGDVEALAEVVRLGSGFVRAIFTAQPALQWGSWMTRSLIARSPAGRQHRVPPRWAPCAACTTPPTEDRA